MTFSMTRVMVLSEVTCLCSLFINLPDSRLILGSLPP